MQKSNPDRALQALLATYGEANTYLRDTSRRIEEHVRFYLTGATALLGAIAYPFFTNSPALLIRIVLALATFALFTLGVVTFLRLISIKTQATQHTAWLKGIEYSLYRLGFGEHIMVKRPQAPRKPSGPFSRFIVMILLLFGVYNSFVIWVSISLATSVLFEFVGYPYFPSTTSVGNSILAYTLVGLLPFVVSTLLHRQQLNKGWKQAFADYEDVLNQTANWVAVENEPETSFIK